MVKIDSFLFEVLKLAYFFVPAYFANMAPVLFSKINFLNYSVDCGLKFRGKRIFGANKTFRGFFFATIVGIVVAGLQGLVNFSNLNMVDYGNFNFILIGFLLGFGALFGDLIESFFKRQLNFKPGQPFIPFDEMDYTLGAFILVTFFYKISVFPFLVLLICTVPVHLLVNYIGFKLKLRKDML